MAAPRTEHGRIPMLIAGVAAGLLPLLPRPVIGLGLAGGLLIFVFVMRDPRVGLFLIAATIPLETAGRIAAFTANLPLTIPKLFTLMTLVAWLVNLTCRRLSFRHLPWMYYLPAFLLCAVASLAGASEIRSGIEAVVRFSSTIVFYFLVIQLLDSEKLLKRCLVVFIVACTLASSWSIVQRFLPGSTFAFRHGWEEQSARRGGIEADIVEQEMVGVVQRSSGLSTHSIILAFNISLLLAPLVAFLGWTSRRAVLQRLAWLAMLATLLASVVVTYARTGFIIVFFAFLLMAWQGLIRLSVAKVATLFAAIALFAAVAPEKYVDRVLSLEAYSSKSASIRIRLDITKAALQQFLDHPILGVGYGNRYGIFDYFTTYLDKKHAVTPHNSYVQVAAQTGLTGLAVLLAFFWKSHGALRRATARFAAANRPDMARIGIGLHISLLIFLFAGLALDLFDKGMPHAWMILGTGGAFALLAEKIDASAAALGSLQEAA